jgi:hypothetical protein
MVRQEYLRRIVDACPLMFHLSATDGCRSHWPYRMQPTHEASPRYSKNSEHYIVDSAIGELTIDNEKTIEKAIYVEADAVVLADYMPFEYYENNKNLSPKEQSKLSSLRTKYGDAYTASLDNIKEGLRIVEKSGFSGKIIVPLQPPHIEFLKALDYPENVAIGGLKDKNAKMKMEAAKTVRNELGEEAFIHGLGFGATETLIREMRDNNNLLDAIDSRTPHHQAMNNFEYWIGREMMSPLSSIIEGYLLESCRRMCGFTEIPYDEEVPDGSLFEH